MAADLFHLSVEIQKGVACKAARVGGEEGGGENIYRGPAGGEDGQCDGEGTFADAGNIIDCKNTHISLLFF